MKRTLLGRERHPQIRCDAVTLPEDSSGDQQLEPAWISAEEISGWYQQLGSTVGTSHQDPEVTPR